MKGVVDQQLRALLSVPISATRDGTRHEIMVWIDTAFNGGLAIPRKQIAELGLVMESSAEAILADGQCVELETYACFLVRQYLRDANCCQRGGVSTARNDALGWSPLGRRLQGQDRRSYISLSRSLVPRLCLETHWLGGSASFVELRSPSATLVG